MVGPKLQHSLVSWAGTNFCPEFSSISSLAKEAQLVNTLPVPESVPECLTVPNLFFFGSLVDQTQLRQHKELAEDHLLGPLDHLLGHFVTALAGLRTGVLCDCTSLPKEVP
jgi:hypothetical protein